jgi:hypothetical protein
MRDLARAAVLASAAATVLAGPGAAEAKTERNVSYSFEQAWPTAVRHLRVEEGFTIVEKDPETGYVVFEVREEGKVFSGALEVVRTKDTAGRASVRLVLRIGERPAYMEAGVLDRMLDKMRQEHGDPPPPPEQPVKKKPKPKS